MDCDGLTSQQKRAITRKAYELRNPEATWARYAVKDARKRAAKKGVPFDLVTKDILPLLKDRCPIFGTPFQYGGNGRIRPESPALDRIKPELGYVKGNVHIISVKANNIKSAYKSEDIMKVATWLQEIENKEG